MTDDEIIDLADEYADVITVLIFSAVVLALVVALVSSIRE